MSNDIYVNGELTEQRKAKKSVEITPSERKAMLEEILEKNPDTIRVEGCAGNSPYATQVDLLITPPADQFGERVSIRLLSEDYTNLGYKNRGYTTFVIVLTPDPAGKYAVCGIDDRGADEILYTGKYLRFWEIQEKENADKLGVEGNRIREILEGLGL